MVGALEPAVHDRQVSSLPGPGSTHRSGAPTGAALTSPTSLAPIDAGLKNAKILVLGMII